MVSPLALLNAATLPRTSRGPRPAESSALVAFASPSAGQPLTRGFADEAGMKGGRLPSVPRKGLRNSP